MALFNGPIIETQKVPMVILKHLGVSGTEAGGQQRVQLRFSCQMSFGNEFMQRDKKERNQHCLLVAARGTLPASSTPLRDT